MEKCLSFVIVEPVSMGLSFGKKGLLGCNHSSWMEFSINVALVKQAIFLLSPADDTNININDVGSKPEGTKRRLLTKEIEGTLWLRSVSEASPTETESSSIKKESSFGCLTYIPKFSSSDYGYNESYVMDVHLPEQELILIRSLFASGKPPSSIYIWTPDVEYGFDSDGSTKYWDVGSKSKPKHSWRFYLIFVKYTARHPGCSKSRR